MSKEDLISELNSLAEEIGYVPRRDEMRDQGEWSAAVYQERFGSWNEAPQAAGFEPNERWRIPREELLAELRAVADKLGHPPTTTEMNEHGKFTIDLYQREFGTWRTALQAADPDYLENYRQSDSETVPFGSTGHGFARESYPVTMNPVSAAVWTAKRTETGSGVISQFSTEFHDVSSTTIQTGRSTMQMSRLTY